VNQKLRVAHLIDCIESQEHKEHVISAVEAEIDIALQFGSVWAEFELADTNEYEELSLRDDEEIDYLTTLDFNIKWAPVDTRVPRALPASVSYAGCKLAKILLSPVQIIFRMGTEYWRNPRHLPK